MTNCSAPGCTNRSSNKKNLSFHRIPKNDDLKKKWLHNLKRQNIPATIFVCSEHFEADCFKCDLRAELMPGTKPKNELKDDAVPTLFQHSQCSSRKRVSSIERDNKKAKKQVVEEAINNYEKTVENYRKDIACSTADLNSVREVAIQNCAKTKSVRTQYREADFIDSEDEALMKAEKIKPLKVKMTKIKKFRDVGTNTNFPFEQEKKPLAHANEIETTDDEGEISDDDDDDSYHPTDNSLDETEDEEPTYNQIDSKDLKPGTKLIVFWSCLITLLKVCQICYQPAKICKIFHKGTKIIVDVDCELKHKYTWHSQPNENGRASGNISLTASIILSGGTYERFSDMFKNAKIPFFSHTTFYKIQKKLVIPAIHRVFTTQRQFLYDDVRDQGKINLLGDGRCDSPGYNAKYGTYTIMDNKTGKIIDMHVSHVGLTGTSAKMELDGLKNILQRLYDKVIMYPPSILFIPSISKSTIACVIN